MDHLFEECAEQFCNDRLPGGKSEYPHIGETGPEDDGQSGISPYTHAIITICNNPIQQALSADFFLSLNPHTKIKILGLPHSHFEDNNTKGFQQIRECIKRRREISDEQIKYVPAVNEDPNDQEQSQESIDLLQRRMQDLCLECWEDRKEDHDIRIVVNMTAGERRQTGTIVNTASAYGCELIYMDIEPGAWRKEIGAPDPRKQFLRVIPNPMGETIGVIEIQLAKKLFNSKSFCLARCFACLAQVVIGIFGTAKGLSNYKSRIVCIKNDMRRLHASADCEQHTMPHVDCGVR